MGISKKKLVEIYRAATGMQDKPLYAFDFGGGAVSVKVYYKEGDITRSYVEIRGAGGVFKLDIDARMPAYAYLLAAAGQDRGDYVEAFALLLYQTLSAVTEDQGFADDLQRALAKYFKRTLKRAEKAAESVTEVEEQGSQALMEEAVELGEEMAEGKRAARRARKKSRQEMEETLREGGIIGKGQDDAAD